MPLTQSKKTKLIQLKYQAPITQSAMINGEFLIEGTALNATTTSNNHRFIPEELSLSANSLNGVPLLVDHRNEVSAIKGIVILGVFNEAEEKINFKAKVSDKEVQELIKRGDLNSVSVGAIVKNLEEAEDGILIPKGITFKELSLVAVPADSGATFGIALKEAYELNQADKDENNWKDTEVENKIDDEALDKDVEEKQNKTKKNIQEETHKDKDIDKNMEKEKCPECGKMIPKKDMKDHMEKTHKEEESHSRSEDLNKDERGLKDMSEEKIEQNSLSELDKILEENNKLKLELAKKESEELRAKLNSKIIISEEPKDVKEDYQIVRGSRSFSVVKNRY